MNKHDKSLFLPAVRALMGDWTYYSTIMKFRDINERVKYAGEIHESKILQDLIQRELSPRSLEISNYLRTQPQRFFNSLIVGVYGGEPKWVELKISESDYLPEFPLSQQGILGFLRLSGEETLFSIDGQHRVAGIKGALEGLPPDSDLFDEEVGVIFLGHSNTPEGKQRTRRLFTTLNRYAKPVKLSEIIALDEDDIAAIITRDLIEEHELFRNSRVSLSKAKSIPKSEKECFTNIVTLYESIAELLPAFLRDIDVFKDWGSLKSQWKEFLKIRPDQAIIERSKDFVKSFWDKTISAFPALLEYLKMEETEIDKALSYRHKEGGNLLFRPIGLMMYAKVIKKAYESGDDIGTTISLVSRIELDIEDAPWKGIIWESSRKRMITRKENKNVGQKLLLYMIGFDIDEAELLDEYASLLERDTGEVMLPQKVV